MPNSSSPYRAGSGWDVFLLAWTTPSLSWTGGAGYSDDGVQPDWLCWGRVSLLRLATNAPAPPHLGARVGDRAGRQGDNREPLHLGVRRHDQLAVGGELPAQPSSWPPGAPMRTRSAPRWAPVRCACRTVASSVGRWPTARRAWRGPGPPTTPLTASTRTGQARRPLPSRSSTTIRTAILPPPCGCRCGSRTGRPWRAAPLP